MCAAWFLFGVVVGIAVLAACLAWDRQAADVVPDESLSERHDRLDGEARGATS